MASSDELDIPLTEEGFKMHVVQALARIEERNKVQIEVNEKVASMERDLLLAKGGALLALVIGLGPIIKAIINV